MKSIIHRILFLFAAMIGITAFASTDTPTVNKLPAAMTEPTLTKIDKDVLVFTGISHDVGGLAISLFSTNIQQGIAETALRQVGYALVGPDKLPAFKAMADVQAKIAEITKSGQRYYCLTSAVIEVAVMLKPEPVFEKDIEFSGAKLNVVAYTDFDEKEAFSSLQSLTGKTYVRATPEQGTWLRTNYGERIDTRVNALGKEIGRNDIMIIPVVVSAEPAKVATTADGGRAQNGG